MISGVMRGEFGYDIMFVAALMKSFSSAVSIHSGFVGGTIFPMVFIGVALGLGFYRYVCTLKYSTSPNVYQFPFILAVFFIFWIFISHNHRHQHPIIIFM
mmetsp:Transcript_15629/g.20064  ORF Transcript_15629/g.20064 Transcript_15629/m.20064 type:complete len:100 (-) Transcript_15629:243-542(-)